MIRLTALRSVRAPVPSRNIAQSMLPERGLAAEGVKHFPVRSATPTDVAIFSAGSQGMTITGQALDNARQADFNVTLLARNPERSRAGATVHCGDRIVDVARHPLLRIASGPLVCDPGRTLVFDTTPAYALGHTVAQTPAGCTVAYSQNGVPGHVHEKQAGGIRAETLVNTFTTRRDPARGVIALPGGTMFIDENGPLVDALHTVLRGESFFKLCNVPDIRAKQYEKIALNCALNISATVFGVTLGELRNMAGREPRCDALIAGLGAEVCAVARAQGFRVKSDDEVADDMHALMTVSAQHPTSMRAAFDAGVQTELDVLNGGISALGRSLGIPTPLNDLMAEKLRAFEALRDAGPGPVGFHRRHAALVRATIDEVLGAVSRRA